MLQAPQTASVLYCSLVPPLLGGVAWRTEPRSSALARSMEPGHGSGALEGESDMDGRGTWHYKQHGTWNQEPCLALSAGSGSGSGAGPCWRGGASPVVQPSLLQSTNLAGRVDLCCSIRTRTASPGKEESVWAAWRQVRSTRTGSEPASFGRGCGLAQEAAPRA